MRDKDGQFSQLPMLSDAERHQQLVEWNATARKYPRDKCIHQLFEKQVEQAPDAVAVVFEQEQLTYAELNRRANQLAHYLQGLGVGPEVRVGLCLERSLELVIGILGILKAGGAYVPLDPDYPPQRLKFLVNDAQTTLVVTQSCWMDQLAASHANLVCLDRDAQPIAQQDDTNLSHTTTAENLAYVMYTSGSTGEPKGIAVSHRAVNRLVLNTDYVQLDEADRIAHASNVSFDAATFEIWGALLVGGTMVIFSKNIILSPDDYASRIREEQISAIFVTTALFNRLTSVQGIFSSVRHVLFGGEAVDPRSVQETLLHDPPERLLHVYGPTEGTTFTTWHRVQEVGVDAYTVPIGRPISNTQVYVLDEYLQPVPIGVVGELFIGGDGLARGYHDRPELTAERFIPHPFSETPGGRLYQTGDLVRYLPDGNLEFVGRRDQQVKIRGFRIELGEIESRLVQHSAVREAVVLAREDTPDDKRLVAYAVCESEEPSIDELRRFLGQQLPSYMVPAAFLFLQSLPLTSNGKVDRQALPALDSTRPELEEMYVAPEAAIEEILTGIWLEVLALERVGLHDNFFALGGHSLLVTQAISRVRQAFGIELPLSVLFELPTVAELAERVQAARGEKTAPALPLEPIPRDTDLPLSFAQQRLWFLDRWQPGEATYNVPGAFRLVGPLDIGRLGRSLNQVVSRHESLRTKFAMVEGRGVQLIEPELAVQMPVTDLRQFSGTEQETECARWLSKKAREPFDLSSGPLFRASVLRLAEEEHVFLLAMHHIVSDGWSLGVLFSELSAAYTADDTSAARLPELPIQYADFAAWQRQWLQGAVLEQQLSYWKEQLDGELPVLELPTDHPRPTTRSIRGAIDCCELSSKLTASLTALSRGRGTTMFMTLLAALQTLLHRYSGQTDIVVGTPIANRNRKEIEGLIGFFVNSLPLRVDLSGDPSFEELLVRVREVALGAYDHQDLPFEKLVEELQVERDTSRTPLFEVMFVVQNTPLGELALPGIAVHGLSVETATAKFDLTISMHESDERLVSAWEYSTALFEPATIRRLQQHFQTLLEGIVADPQQRLSELTLLSEQESHQQLVEWNATAREYPRDKCIHELFEKQVQQAPDAVAVVFEQEQLTYAELNRRANQLAHYLQGLGVGPEVRVGLCLERSLELVIGILGILKAGGAYVPLDPDYPPQRLKFLVNDAQTPLVVTQSCWIDQLAASHANLVCLDRDAQPIAQQDDTNLSHTTTAENLAYVMYTSGSTGEPKGIAVSHRAVNRLVLNTDYVQLDEADRIAHASNVSFDAATFEIWGALLVGGAMVIFSKNIILSPDDYALRIREEQISAIFVTTALFNRLTSVQGIFSSVRHVLFGGEAVDPRSVQETLLHDPPERLFHVYGPTEGTTFTTWHRVQEVGVDAYTVPIGRPISNTQVYVLDEYLQPVPIGVVGELFIGGDGLARGYHDRPELTAERFIPHPFGETPGGRLYQTGDLVRYLPDGNLEFVGRRDHQVKLRGFRIELGEIEVVLTEHSDIQSSIVVLEENSVGERQLTAYLVPVGETQPTARQMRDYLSQRMPKYMVPAAYVTMDTLPLTSIGKVDRRSLPRPVRANIAVPSHFQAPRDALEMQLTKIWEDVLDVRQIGLDDDFFDLGGHSLLALTLLARIEQLTGKKLPISTLFQAPSVRCLANIMHEENWQPSWTSLTPVQPGGSRTPLFLVPPAASSAMRFIPLSRCLSDDQPVYSFNLIGEDGQEIRLDRVEDIAAQFVQEMLMLQPRGPYLVGGMCFGAHIAYEMAQQLAQKGHEAAVLVLDGPAPANGPNWRRRDWKRRRLAVIRRAIYHLRHGTLFVRGTLMKVRNIRAQFDAHRQAEFQFQERANLNYCAKPFLGNVAVFVSPENNHPEIVERWASLVRGSFSKFVIPGTSHDSLLLTESGIRPLAQQIRSFLDDPDSVQNLD